PLARRCAKLAFRWGAHRDHPAENLDLDPRDRSAVEPAINDLEELADGRVIASREVAHRKRDRDFVALAAIAHESGALLHQFGGGGAAPPRCFCFGGPLCGQAGVPIARAGCLAAPTLRRG